jgi:hypothetical protein
MDESKARLHYTEITIDKNVNMTILSEKIQLARTDARPTPGDIMTHPSSIAARMRGTTCIPCLGAAAATAFSCCRFT